MRLGEYLDQAARTPFAWGRHDCLLWLADWAVLTGHSDPGASWRGRYHTALGCKRLVTRAGGMAAIARAGAEAVGLAPIQPGCAALGDIGVGRLGLTDWGAHSVGLLRTGLGWAALKSGGGVMVGPATVSTAWRI